VLLDFLKVPAKRNRVAGIVHNSAIPANHHDSRRPGFVERLHGEVRTIKKTQEGKLHLFQNLSDVLVPFLVTRRRGMSFQWSDQVIRVVALGNVNEDEGDPVAILSMQVFEAA
jgi:hypothetical protein